MRGCFVACEWLRDRANTVHEASYEPSQRTGLRCRIPPAPANIPPPTSPRYHTWCATLSSTEASLPDHRQATDAGYRSARRISPPPASPSLQSPPPSPSPETPPHAPTPPHSHPATDAPSHAVVFPTQQQVHAASHAAAKSQSPPDAQLAPAHNAPTAPASVATLSPSQRATPRQTAPYCTAHATRPTSPPKLRHQDACAPPHAVHDVRHRQSGMPPERDALPGGRRAAVTSETAPSRDAPPRARSETRGVRATSRRAHSPSPSGCA